MLAVKRQSQAEWTHDVADNHSLASGPPPPPPPPRKRQYLWPCELPVDVPKWYPEKRSAVKQAEQKNL